MKIPTLGLAASFPALLAVLGAASSAWATDVVGNINVDTRWSLTGSPYRLTGDVTIAPQATLTIEPGVSIVAAATDQLGAGTDASRVELVVRGRMLADGSLASPISFAPEGGSWYGISFESAAGPSTLTQTRVTGATIGVLCRALPGLTFSDVTIESGDQGVRWQCQTPLTATRISIARMTAGGIDLVGDGGAATLTMRSASIERTVEALTVRGGGIATVEGSSIFFNQTGIHVEDGGSLALRSSLLSGNSVQALLLHQSGARTFTIVNNTFDRNMPNPGGTPGGGAAIRITGVSDPAAFVVRNNLITNQGLGIEVTPPAQPSLDHNDVWNNGTNYSGASQGVGSISVNPLYTAPIGEWIRVDQPVSIGSVPNGYSNSWTFTQPDAVYMRLVIPTFSSEACCDFLRIYDEGGSVLQTISGSFSGTTVDVPGSTVRATFTTDGSVISAGFTISGYEWQSPQRNYRLTSTSPAIDVGNPIGAPSTDFDGTARPYDGDVDGTAVVDLGAFEWHENLPPLAVAGADRVVHPAEALDFDGRGSRDPDGTIVTYAWDFGDGATATGPTASHAFSGVGTFTVTLTVTDLEGATGTDTAQVVVTTNLPPIAAAGPDQSAAVGGVVTLDGGGSTDSDGSIVSYSWDFGDGSPVGSGRVVTHAWVAARVYTVTLTVTDNGGATATDTASIVIGGGPANLPPNADAGGPYTAAVGAAVALDGSLSSDSDGNVVSYSWDFGDGSVGTGSQPTHTYASAGSFLVRLTVTDDDGATDDDVALATISAVGNSPPTARAGGPYSARLGDSVRFDGSASSDSDGTIASYAWDFGDGATATSATADHTYATAGNFLARLTVTDDDGATDDEVALVAITVEGNSSPTADAGGPYAAKIGAMVAFDGSASADSDGTIASYAWDFGDGSTGAGASTTHAYAAAGTFTVRLTVTDDDGAVGQDTTLAVITDEAQPNNAAPVASAGGDRTVTAGEALLLNGAASTDSDGTIVTYAWDLGDGSTADGAAVQHTYAAAGAYVVKLTVTDDKGATDEDFAQITVRARMTLGDDTRRVEESGCGCRTTSPLEASSFSGLVVLGLAFLARRRFRFRS
ncbi:MAG: PKD domain-containing protein [Deltaproteobacteria bacterium]|nr:PKD domain-containing protein [Deltaproteobacteria bacterium]